MRGISRLGTIGVLATLVLVGPVFAQTFTSGSTGADGALNPTTNTTLALPPSGVFNFTTVNIPSNITVKFTRNTANTPVTMLATGNVTIAGFIDIRGAGGATAATGGSAVGSNGGVGGPGGFDGGGGATGVVSTAGGSGLGPGGAAGGSVLTGGGGGGGHLVAGTAGKGTGSGAAGGTYGTPSLLPLIGGSGGGGGGASPNNTGGGGGGGGGALLIASSGTITLTGQILANGGTGGGIGGVGVAAGGGGSGGSVRLIATSITGANGVINVAGGAGGALTTGVEGGGGSPGRVRVEGLTNTLSVISIGTTLSGALSVAAPTSITLPNAPTLRITAVGGVAAPTVPSGSLTVADVVLPATITNPVTVSLAATNIPLGTTVIVTVKGFYDAASSTVSTPLAGTLASSTATASVTIPTNEPCVIGASASFLLASAEGGVRRDADGEHLERVALTPSTRGPTVASLATSPDPTALGLTR